MKHTKGKWAWQRFGDHYHLAAQHGMREIIISANIVNQHSLKPCVTMNIDGILKPINPDHPNAKLIAKAPEMLQALKDCLFKLDMAHNEYNAPCTAEISQVIKLINEIEK